jgi:hypothetical protein
MTTDQPVAPNRELLKVHLAAVARAKPEPGELLATFHGWQLHADGPSRDGGWYNFVLVSPSSVQVKRKYRGGWNGKRRAGSRDIGILKKHEADIFDCLLDACRQISWAGH